MAVLSRLDAATVEQVEQLRGIQMQNLVSQAELKALQAQINPTAPAQCPMVFTRTGSWMLSQSGILV